VLHWGSGSDGDGLEDPNFNSQESQQQVRGSASASSLHTPSRMPAYSGSLACSDSTLQACQCPAAGAELLSEAEMCLRLRDIVDPTQPQALSLRYVLLCSRFTERARHWHGASPKDIQRICLISCERERNQNENHEFSERICHSSCAQAA
jgi:hypothetical protein